MECRQHYVRVVTVAVAGLGRLAIARPLAALVPDDVGLPFTVVVACHVAVPATSLRHYFSVYFSLFPTGTQAHHSTSSKRPLPSPPASRDAESLGILYFGVFILPLLLRFPLPPLFSSR